MADIAPLFVADADSLRASLRLSALTTSPSDAAVLVDDAIREVRLGFLRRLGLSRTAALVALVYDPTAGAPTTEDEILRECANLTEILWVKKLLLTRLPTLFRDSAGESRLDFNTEALTRESPAQQQQVELDRLDSQIEENLELLAGDSEAQNESNWKVSTIGPTNPFRPEDSVFPRKDEPGFNADFPLGQFDI